MATVSEDTLCHKGMLLRGVVFICSWELLLLPRLFLYVTLGPGEVLGGPLVFHDLLINDSLTTSAG